MKKANGEGTIYKRGNKWRGQICIGGDRLSVTGNTKHEVSDKLAAIRTDFERGMYVRKNDITVYEWCEHCIDNKLSKILREQSLIGYKGLFKNHIYPDLGDIRLQDLNKQMLEVFYAKKYNDCNYSRSTVNAVSSRFKKILSYAVEDKLLVSNPHDGVSLHKLRPPKKIEAYNRDDTIKILNRCKNGKPYEQIFYFLTCTGMRIGETIALTWDDVDFEHKCVSVNKTAVSIHGNMTIQEHTKTDSGNRKLYLAESVLTFLNTIRSSQNQDLNCRNLVFPNSNYNIMHETNARTHFIRLCKEINIGYKGVHALRHTWATRALEEGINIKVVSAMLGHKNVITTMNIYQDVMPDEQLRAARMIDEMGATRG